MHLNGNIFEQIQNSEVGINLPEGWVRGTYLWMVDDDEFVGEVCIRHTLTNALAKFGGNIGYGVRYSRWNEGIATKMLFFALEYAKQNLYLNKVLITCSDDNFAFARVIEKNGGTIQDVIESVINGNKRMTKRYWIKL